MPAPVNNPNNDDREDKHDPSSTDEDSLRLEVDHCLLSRLTFLAIWAPSVDLSELTGMKDLPPLLDMENLAKPEAPLSASAQSYFQQHVMVDHGPWNDIKNIDWVYEPEDRPGVIIIEYYEESMDMVHDIEFP